MDSEQVVTLGEIDFVDFIVHNVTEILGLEGIIIDFISQKVIEDVGNDDDAIHED